MLPAPIPTAIDSTNLAELKQRAAREDPAALAEAAVQFEALFIGMMLESARDASLAAGVFDNSQTQQYLELMDQQVALDLARTGGFGIGKMLLEQLGVPAGASAARPVLRGPETPAAPAAAYFPRGLPATLLARPAHSGPPPRVEALQAPGADGPSISDAASFVWRFAADAAAAAAKLGVAPKLLLAQAALETGWGDASPRHPDGRPTFNMFGIKAGSGWTGGSAVHWTLETSGGVTERKRALFRAYPNSTASFADYVELIASSPRYAAARDAAPDPERYVHAIAAAGYATDPAYAAKWLSIYRGDRLTSAWDALKHGTFGPTQ
jgi:flagellar protein FlgJ